VIANELSTARTRGPLALEKALNRQEKCLRLFDKRVCVPGGARARGASRRAHGFVDEDLDAVPYDRGRPQSHALLRRGASEEALPLPEDHRIDDEPELVQEIMLEESLHQRGAAVNDDGSAVPLAQAADFLHEVTAEDRRVAPLGRAQGRGDDVFGHAVREQ
jgi:hypothetical protein